MESVNAVEVRQWHWRYPAFVGDLNPLALAGVDLTVRRGEFFGLTGPSGAGKSTLCKSIVGIIPHGVKIPGRQVNLHVAGSVRVLDQVVAQVDPRANVVGGEPLGAIHGAPLAAPRVGMVMQDPENQFLKMTVLHEVAFGLQLQGLPPEKIRLRVQEALEMVGLGHLWPNAAVTHPAELSGGQKQRVAIASFLAMRPQVLILDEPTSDLDPAGRQEVIATVRRLKEQHALTVILVEQDPGLLAGFCDRVALMDSGRVEMVAPPDQFYAQTDRLGRHGVYFFEVSRVAHETGIRVEGRVPYTIAEALQCFPRDVDPAAAQEPPPATGDMLVEAHDVWFRYEDGTLALKGAELVVRRGETVALLGTNGSGKTTLAKILNGIYRPERGMARVLGQDVTHPKVRSRLPAFVGYVFQNPDHQIFMRRVVDEVRYGLTNLGIPEAEVPKRLRSALAAVDLLTLEHEDPLFLGKGQRQRLAVAAVLAMQPELLIVDEPTTGQDYRMVSSIMALLMELHRSGRTILIITHDMTLVANYCQRAVVLRDGRTVFDGTPRQLFSDTEVLSGTGLTAPQAIRLSCAIRREQDFPLLLNVDEWVCALGGARQVAQAGGQVYPKEGLVDD